MLKDKVEALLQAYFEEHPNVFLIDLKIAPDNSIDVVIDGDNGVTLNDCIAVSRQIEHNLNREEEDFSLEVASPGATEAIVNSRQYNKNIGRNLKVKTLENSFEGKLITVSENGIVLEWTSREPKPVGKGKITVTKEKLISFNDIVEAKVTITF